jgi:hypothetical protein
MGVSHSQKAGLTAKNQGARRQPCFRWPYGYGLGMCRLCAGRLCMHNSSMRTIRKQAAQALRRCAAAYQVTKLDVEPHVISRSAVVCTSAGLQVSSRHEELDD